MTSKKQLLFALGLAIHLLLVGIICYAAFPAKAKDQPIRIMYKGAAGKVLFDHETHYATAGFAISCEDCHHHYEEDEETKRACGDCHQEPAEDEAFPESCGECHEPDEIEGTEMQKRVDAFHSQCIQCHQEFEAGPEECAQCHVI